MIFQLLDLLPLFFFLHLPQSMLIFDTSTILCVVSEISLQYLDLRHTCK